MAADTTAYGGNGGNGLPAGPGAGGGGVADARSGRGLLRHALFNQYNVILLGGSCLYALALASPLPLAIGACGELVWLLLGARSGAFRRWVAGQALGREHERWRARIDGAAATLDPDGAARVRVTGDALADLARAALERGPERALGPGGVSRLWALLDACAELCATHQRLSLMVANGRALAVEEEMVRLAKSVVDERDPTARMSLRQALGMGQRRLKQLEQVEGARRALRAKLDELETSLEHARAQVAAGASAAQVAAGLAEALAAARFGNDVEADAARVLGPAGAPTGPGASGVITGLGGPGAPRATGSVLIRPA